ncbi:hypothetical protein ACJMK2_029324, partial [Sinanodonta woodiana]
GCSNAPSCNMGSFHCTIIHHGSLHCTIIHSGVAPLHHHTLWGRSTAPSYTLGSLHCTIIHSGVAPLHHHTTW